MTPQDFGPYFRSVHDFDPFPWQQRLLEQVHREGRFPATLSLPTGSGKTAVLDVLVFALALEAARPADERRLPRRGVMVVDRRVVVDQAYARAKCIADALRKATDGVLASVAQALRGLHGEADQPLMTAVLRGGIPRDASWARTPDQVLLLSSTVDQVGSRILFRGYGVGPGSAPIHAGLMGEDCCFFLDEVHLSEPFRQTLEQLEGLAMDQTRRWQVVNLSATPGEQPEPPFTLDTADHAHPVLVERIQARKPCRLVELGLPSKPDAQRKAIAKGAVEQAKGLLKAHRTVAVLVNRVETARLIEAALRASKVNTLLVTGRMRPLDRQDRLAQHIERLRSGRDRPEDLPPLVVVSTQSLEAGADLDFDAMVSEVASIDALQQRFGRLDRLGRMAKLGLQSEGVILGGPKLPEDDPVYGPAMAATWRWLSGLEQVDLGIAQLPTPPLLAHVQRPDAPVLMPAYLDLWSQTKPRPLHDPDISLWLHGKEPSRPEVQIIWRHELELLRPPAGADWDLELLAQALSACRPSSLEALSVPIWAAEAWLRERLSEGVADVEGLAGEAGRGSFKRQAFRWQGKEIEVVKGRLKPGDTLLVACDSGGLCPHSGAWDPASTARVADQGERAQALHRRRRVVRLSEGFLQEHQEQDSALYGVLSQSPRPVADEDERELSERVDGWLEEHDHPALAPFLGRKQVTAVGLRYAVLGTAEVDPGELDSSDESTSFLARRVSLDSHLQGVGARAGAFAERLGLTQALVQDLRLSGLVHDLGKADPRFQRMMWEGDELAQALSGALLAKSAIPPWARRRREQARKAAGYPQGTRHELTSVALLQSNPAAMALANDPELVLHLVASHHGWCRPFPPACADGEPVTVRVPFGALELEVSSDHGLQSLGGGAEDRFWRLQARYGWHRLAWLESILRLADHRQSEHEARNPDGEVSDV